MTEAQIEDVIKTLRADPHHAGSDHVSVFEFIYDADRESERVRIEIYDSGDCVLGPGGQLARYRCDIRTSDGTLLEESKTAQYYSDPITAVKAALKHLFSGEL
jgi:hypothetical protein